MNTGNLPVAILLLIVAVGMWIPDQWQPSDYLKRFAHAAGAGSLLVYAFAGFDLEQFNRWFWLALVYGLLWGRFGKESPQTNLQHHEEE